MEELFKPDCAVDDANVGIPSCKPQIEVLKGAIFAQTRKEYTDTTLSAFITSLQADVLNATKSERIYPFFEFSELAADNTEETPKIVKGSGSVIFGADKKRDFRYEYKNVGLEAFKKFKRASGSFKYFFGYDLKDQFICAANSSGNAIPIEIEAMHVHEPMYNQDTTVNFFVDIITADPFAFGLNAKIVDFSTSPLNNELSGLYDVTMAATGGSTEIAITADVDVSGEDFIEKYETDLVVGSFVVTDESDGSVETPSGIAITSSGGTYTATLTVTAGTYTVKLAAPATLVGQSIGSASEGGYESNILTGITATA